jgi:hypothetical protein
MSLSAYAIGDKVWLVHTDSVAEPGVPNTLPIGSIILTPDEAVALKEQLVEAFTDASSRRAKKAEAGMER